MAAAVTARPPIARRRGLSGAAGPARSNAASGGGAESPQQRERQRSPHAPRERRPSSHEWEILLCVVLDLVMRRSHAMGGTMKKARDPVCGMKVKQDQAAGTSEYRGVTYFFCSEQCKE